jgi:hypothetical protein
VQDLRVGVDKSHRTEPYKYKKRGLKLHCWKLRAVIMGKNHKIASFKWACGQPFFSEYR